MAEVDLELTGMIVRHQVVVIVPRPVIDRVERRRASRRSGTGPAWNTGLGVSGRCVAVGGSGLEGRGSISVATAAVVSSPASALPTTRATPGRQTADGTGPRYEPDASSASI